MADPENVEYVKDENGNIIDIIEKLNIGKKLKKSEENKKSWAEKNIEEEEECLKNTTKMPDIHNLNSGKDCDGLIKWLVMDSINGSKGGSLAGLRKSDSFMKIAATVKSLRDSDYTDLQSRIDGLLGKLEQLEDQVKQASMKLEEKDNTIKQLERDINTLRASKQVA